MNKTLLYPGTENKGFTNYKESKEERITSDIFDFVAGTCGNRNLTKEFCLINSLASDTNKAKTRRIDFVQVNSKSVIGYEVKEKPVSLKDISDCIGYKGYIDLLKVKYPDKTITLTFMGMQGIQEGAERLINNLGESASFISVSDFCYEAYNRSINNNHSIDYFYVQLQAMRYSYLFTEEQINHIKQCFSRKTKQ